METIKSVTVTSKRVLAGLHVPSRLEGMETFDVLFCQDLKDGLHVPSRLEGMETELLSGLLRTCLQESTCAFPFGGNGNVVFCVAFAVFCGSLHVPSRLEGMETMGEQREVFALLGLHVPSRLEGMETQQQKNQERACCHAARHDNVYMCLPVWREWKLVGDSYQLLDEDAIGLHVPSRLEGMETLSTIKSSDRFEVYMCLPVWREWKRILRM